MAQSTTSDQLLDVRVAQASPIYRWYLRNERFVLGLLGFVATGSSMDPNHLTAPKLLGLFPVNVVHNIVHLLFGVWGVIGARSFGGARSYLLGAGVVYAVLFIYGLFVGEDDDANFIPMNNADDWLHLLLAVALLGSYFLTGRDRDRGGAGT